MTNIGLNTSAQGRGGDTMVNAYNTTNLNSKNVLQTKHNAENGASKLSQNTSPGVAESYETDDYITEYPERMQLNPRANDYGDESSYDDGEDELETLPEAKKLIQPLANGKEESNKNLSTTTEKQDQLEEEDMGFDEDDERIAIVVERQRDINMKVSSDYENDNDKGFMNEEGSGDSNWEARRRHKSNNIKLDYLEKYHQKVMENVNVNRDDSDPREGSGNFANDDEDNDDDDDGDDADDHGAVDDSNDNGEFFNPKHTNSNSRYFRKNTNDAIKIISTPLGKVGIVYQQTSIKDDNKKPNTPEDKKTSSFTDFDALSPDPESSHRLASSHPKITPVLTPDGKVALLYRGDSENSKYEPIRNLTHQFLNKNDATDNKANAAATLSKNIPEFQNNDGSNGESSNESEDDYDLDSGSEIANESGSISREKTTDTESNAIIHSLSVVTPSSTGSFILRPTDSILPMINRPLSEVLGIKKNQFKQFRIKDNPTSASNTKSDIRSQPGLSVDHTVDTTTLHFLTKVNLAEYPTPSKTRNLDFDFSRDNTMLDERPRHNEQPHRHHLSEANNINTNSFSDGNNQIDGIANEEVLAKTEVVNLAIIPHFDEELDRLKQLREHESRRHYRQRYRQKKNDEDLSGIHCIMQAMMGIAAISTVFGMIGTFFKQRILDQIRLMHW